MTLLDTYRPLLERALAENGNTHTIEDVQVMTDAGAAQVWPLPQSIIVTQILDYPQAKTCHVFLAAGRLPEIEAATPIIEDWARRQGCTRATLIGRRGWQRSFLTQQDWQATAVLMEKPL